MPAKSTILVYGDSGAGKTSLIESLAVWLWRKEKKRTRLVSGDGGRWDSIQHVVDAGLVEPWDISTHVFPFETLQFAAQGYWPSDVSDPKSLLRPPAPTTWANIGAVAFEGLTGFGNMMLGALSDRGAKGEKIGQDAPGRFKDGKAEFAGANMTYYGIAQRRLQDAVDKSRALPIYLLWTALQLRATDTDTNLPIFGPELVGKAKTGDCPRWFANTLCLSECQVGAGKKERRLYLQTYFDPVNTHIPHVCKSRIPALVTNTPFSLNGVSYQRVPDYLVLPERPPRDQAWGLGLFLDMVALKTQEAQAVYGKEFTSTTTQRR